MTFVDYSSNSDLAMYFPELQKVRDLYFQFPLFNMYNIGHISVQSLTLIHFHLSFKVAALCCSFILYSFLIKSPVAFDWIHYYFSMRLLLLKVCGNVLLTCKVHQTTFKIKLHSNARKKMTATVIQRRRKS